MKINKNDTAVVVIEPQNDVLRETGIGWDFVGTSSPAFSPEYPSPKKPFCFLRRGIYLGFGR